MTRSYAYTPQIWVPLLACALIVILGVHAWRRRHLPGALQFAATTLFASLWIAGSVLEYAAVDLATKAWWYKFEVLWQLPTTTAMTCFVLEYAWPGRWLSRRTAVALFLPSVIMGLLTLTNDAHGLIWVSLVTETAIVPVRGPANWLFLGYWYVLTGFEFAALIWLLVRSAPHRWQAAIMLATKASIRTTYFAKALRLAGINYPSDVLIIGFAAIMYAVVLFGFRGLDPVAQARQLAAEQMRDGMLVTDPNGSIAAINPAAMRILGLSERNVTGQPLASFAGIDPAVRKSLAGASEEWRDLPSLQDHPSQHVLYSATHLSDFRGLPIGKLILLRDITAERHAQEQVIAQQRSLATLTERERLARELHDSLGQALAATHLQASTARLLLEQGKHAEADRSMQFIAHTSLAAETDIREYILGARIFAATDLPFFTKLERYVSSFATQYGIDVRLNWGTELGHGGFAAAVETQLMRIMQEALSNIRKHAAATTVKVSFTRTGRELQVAIVDDGCGFDQAAVRAGHDHGYGLQTMRERTESLGGSFVVNSAPGHGTRLTVTVPLEGDSQDG